MPKNKNKNAIAARASQILNPESIALPGFSSLRRKRFA
jgi:hypothetical protein